MGFRYRRQEVEGWGDVIVLESMRIRRPHENASAAVSDFSTLRPGFKKVRFQVLRLQDPCGRSAKMMQKMCVYTEERFRLDSLIVVSLIATTCSVSIRDIVVNRCYGKSW